MGYRITYGQTVTYKIIPNKKTHRRRFAVVIVVFALLVGLLSFKSIWKQMLPGEEHITFQALSHMVEHLRNGETMKKAVTAFCQELVSYDK